MKKAMNSSGLSTQAKASRPGMTINNANKIQQGDCLKPFKYF